VLQHVRGCIAAKVACTHAHAMYAFRHAMFMRMHMNTARRAGSPGSVASRTQLHHQRQPTSRLVAPPARLWRVKYDIDLQNSSPNAACSGSSPYCARVRVCHGTLPMYMC
jgi:hypothetical protein